jgi:hypothetical protein
MHDRDETDSVTDDDDSDTYEGPSMHERMRKDGDADVSIGRVYMTYHPA